MTPANTPVRLPRTDSGSMPARSNASPAVSSSSPRRGPSPPPPPARRLQQQPLLRVHRDRLTRRDAEERGIEVRRVVEEPALPRVRGTGVVGVRVVEVRVPSPVGRKLAHRVPSLRDQPPKVLRAGDAA